jgi:hypothetical protein
MLRFCIRAAVALKQLRNDAKGVVSFEYVVVSACIIAVVGAAFNTGASGPIKTTLTNALITIGTALGAAVGS